MSIEEHGGRGSDTDKTFTHHSNGEGECRFLFPAKCVHHIQNSVHGEGE
jgi:hypothetical protein